MALVPILALTAMLGRKLGLPVLGIPRLVVVVPYPLSDSPLSHSAKSVVLEVAEEAVRLYSLEGVVTPTR